MQDDGASEVAEGVEEILQHHLQEQLVRETQLGCTSSSASTTSARVRCWFRWSGFGWCSCFTVKVDLKPCLAKSGALISAGHIM